MENLIKILGTLDYHSKNEGKETAYQISTKKYFVKDGEGLSPIDEYEETIFNYDLKDFIHSNDNILSLVSSLRQNLVESTVNSRIKHEESMSKARAFNEKACIYVGEGEFARLKINELFNDYEKKEAIKIENTFNKIISVSNKKTTKYKAVEKYENYIRLSKNNKDDNLSSLIKINQKLEYSLNQITGKQEQKIEQDTRSKDKSKLKSVMFTLGFLAFFTSILYFAGDYYLNKPASTILTKIETKVKKDSYIKEEVEIVIIDYVKDTGVVISPWRKEQIYKAFQNKEFTPKEATEKVNEIVKKKF